MVEKLSFVIKNLWNFEQKYRLISVVVGRMDRLQSQKMLIGSEIGASSQFQSMEFIERTLFPNKEFDPTLQYIYIYIFIECKLMQ